VKILLLIVQLLVGLSCLNAQDINLENTTWEVTEVIDTVSRSTLKEYAGIQFQFEENGLLKVINNNDTTIGNYNLWEGALSLNFVTYSITTDTINPGTYASDTVIIQNMNTLNIESIDSDKMKCIEPDSPNLGRSITLRKK